MSVWDKKLPLVGGNVAGSSFLQKTTICKEQQTCFFDLHQLDVASILMCCFFTFSLTAVSCVLGSIL